MADLERPKIKVGFIPIIDCAAIVLAEELGAYERQGLEVEIRREVSWANVRDKLALGALDASHILAPLPLALTLGIDSVSVPVINAMTLRGERQRAHPVEEPVAGDGRDGAAVRRRRPVRRSTRAPSPPWSPGGRPMAPSRWSLASVFPYSVQNYMLRLWLSSAGLDPDRDVRLAVVPPPHTVAYLSGGVIDGYCVGEPWNQQSEALGIGRIALTGPDIWKGMPEKVLGTTESWAANNPQTLKALIKALIEACLWLDEPANRAEAARILSSPRYLNMPAEVMSRTLDLPDFHVFQRNAANFPWRSHADWFLAQMVRWKQAPADTDIKAVADRVYRTDIYRAAARDMGVDCPDVDRLPPGGHGEPLLPASDDRSSTAAAAGVGRGSN